MRSAEVTGIIDIGSNTVRLAVYRMTQDRSYRIIDQGRWPARLSQRLTPDGELPDEAVNELSEVLLHYRSICRMHGALRIRAVATAAIRAAVNRERIIRRLKETTGLDIEILPGEEEARIGSLGMLGTLNLSDGFVVDIGGGSTEITLLKNRHRLHSVSFPIGSVNTAARFGLEEGPVESSVLHDIQEDTRKFLNNESWISRHPGLPLIGLGGTVRAFAKLRQHQTEYPFPLLHGYEQTEDELSSELRQLSEMPVSKRRKLPGLSKDRADVIVPGMAILRSVMRECGSDRLVVCGAGLRDGLFFETCLPGMETKTANQVLEDSIRNLHALYPTIPREHLEQVRLLVLSIYDRLAKDSEFPSKTRVWLEAAAMLFRIGAVIDLNDVEDHTFYMLIHTHWNGLPHREILLTAAIASFKGMNQLRRKLSPYRSMLHDGDVDTAAHLGSLLQLAAALDRSQSQAIRSLQVEVSGNQLRLKAQTDHPLSVEQVEVEALSKDFKKIWGIKPVLHMESKD
ncbi:MAG: Ppx/GppA family phosphatase [Cohnella sp.]|nr:Ppx/GppA family phosphatase [Cohnella sp.]